MIIFRADGNSTIGLGHIMRCLSIADAAAAFGEACLFVTADKDGARFAVDRGCKAISLNSDYRQLDGEISKIGSLLTTKKPQALLLDSYFVTDTYLSALRKACRAVDCKLTYLDDVLSFPYACDVLVNYNLFASAESYRKLYEKAPLNCPALFLGTQYAPLRREFQGRPPREARARVSDVFVSTGGADPEHVALRYLRHLEDATEMKSFHFHLLLGKMNADAPKIRLLARSLANVTLHENVSEMYALMSRCDAAISASGSTLYELCASGVPIISYVAADNQLENARALHEAGAALYAGDVRENESFPDAFDEALRELDRSVTLRRTLTCTAYGLVDGNGAERLVRSVLCRNPAEIKGGNTDARQKQR